MKREISIFFLAIIITISIGFVNTTSAQFDFDMEFDDLMDATRYALMGLRFAEVV